MIDVNANFDNDVFLSSKVFSYLPYNRLIISESGNGSPVRSMFKTSQAILHVHHRAEEFNNAMESCINNIGSIDYSEREEYLKRMDINAATDTFINQIYENNEN